MVDTDAGVSPRLGGRKSRHATQRNPRLRLACLRCQRRKIRCGGEIPACKNCTNVGAECQDGESARLRDLPRAYMVNLKSRVSWLESIVKERCPDVDLSQGPLVEDIVGGDDSVHGVDAPVVSPAPHTSLNQAPSDQLVQNASGLSAGPPMRGANALSHEIGLVSLGTNQDPRYIGPSSGYFLARVMLTKPSSHDERVAPPIRDLAFPSDLVEAVQGPLPLPPSHMAGQLCEAYFELIHPQYPILHKPTFMRMVDQIYEQPNSDPVIAFQVNMVFALGATIMSARLRARIPGESYCLSAMQHFHRLNVENSLQGLQCLLLLLIFAIHNPYVRLNVWYLNYQCIAALLDLGLQREITVSSGITLLEQEMRVRIFWVIFMLDRIIATMMGRPIGLRDEACELRMPKGLSDLALMGDNHDHTSLPPEASPSMAYSTHLFRLSLLNSEIKYVANSIIREAPQYAYPRIRDIHEWQSSMLKQVDEWATQIPSGENTVSGTNMHLTCQLRYHSLRMLLLRPSPAIPKPSMEALTTCHESARQSIHIFDQLYKKNLLIHSWMTFHSLVLSTITMIYCVKVVPDLARRTELDIFMGDLSIVLSLLSATGEHWSGAKRSRDILDDLGRSTIRWLQETPSSRNGHHSDAANPPRSRNPVMSGTQMSTASLPTSGDILSMDSTSMPFLAGYQPQLDGLGASGFVQNQFDDFLANPSFSDYFDPNEPTNMDNIVRDLFQGFIPTYQTFT